MRTAKIERHLDAQDFSGDVTLIGLGGDDTLRGGSGNDIVLGEETHRQLDGIIPCEALGEFALKGLSRKIAAYRVR